MNNEMSPEFSAGRFDHVRRIVMGRVAPVVSALALLAVTPGSERQIEAPLAACDEPTSQDIAAINALLDAPTDPYVQERTVSGMDEQAASHFKGRHTERALVDINKHIADQLGLETHDYMAYDKELREDGYNPEGRQIPFSTYIDSANQFSKLFGIEISVSNDEFPFTYLNEGERAPTEIELEGVNAKNNITKLMENLGITPEELFKLAGLKQVVLTYIPEFADGSMVHAYVPLDNPGVYVVNVNGYLERRTYAHELYHMVDNQQCDDDPNLMYTDPAYHKLSDGIIYENEGADVSKVVTVESISNWYSANPGLTEAWRNKDAKTYCKYEAIAKQMQQDAQAVSYYSLKNAAEEKAETFGDMMDTQLQEGGVLIEDAYPTIKEKSIYLMARLYSRVPRVAEFFIKVNAPIDWGEEDQPSPDQIVC